MQKSRYKTNLGKSLAQLAQDSNLFRNFANGGAMLSNNDKFNLFQSTGIRRKEGLANNAVSVSYSRPNEYARAQIGKFNPYGNLIYAALNNNKAGRLYEYRLMAAFSEVTNALEHICNEFITIKDGQVAELKYTKPKASVSEEKTINEEFKMFLKLFNFEEKGFDYCWRFLTEGELFLELIVNNSRPENIKAGILGAVDIPAELVTPVWKSKSAKIIDWFVGSKPIYSEDDPERLEKIELVPYQANQLLYVYSGNWDPEGEYMVPFIERARRRYIQLSYIEDAIVIYRLVRAPERLVFTVPTGNMAPYDAERYMRNLMENYWKTKVMDVNTTDIAQKYNPQSMTDAYYFAKPQSGEAISVTQLKGGDNLGELKDLEFFQRALYRDLKIPTSYLAGEHQVSPDSSQILIEQLRFADFITNIQRRFAYAIKQAFITHLKLKGMWEEYHLHETHIEIRFFQPSTYYLMRELQITKMRNDIFTSVASNEVISKIYALKRYFEWSDDDILANIEFLKSEAAMLWEVQQRREYGPAWKNAITGQGEGDIGGMGGGMPGGMDMGGGLGMPGGGDMEGIPDFGGGPAAEGPPMDSSDSPPSAGDIEPV